MRTTKQLSKALEKIQNEAIERIKSFFNGKSYVRIVIMPSQHLTVVIDTTTYCVDEIGSNGVVNVSGVKHKKGDYDSIHLEDLSVDALLTILDELERMKKHNQLKKP